MALLLSLAASVLPLITATPTPQLSGLLPGPQKTLDYGTFEGNQNFAGVDSYLGMPFAVAGRFQNPRVIGSQDKLQGVQDATKYGLACPQQQLVASPLYSQNAEIGGLLAAVEQIAFAPVGNQNQGEDCLTINVQIPSGLNSTAGLPVMMWIFGGGFELGSSASLGSEATAVQGLIYQGARIVQRSIEMGKPIVFVSANYRVNAFGGMASQEITDAGVANLHLKDQRVAMQWVQKYITKFGGDKTKVTLFGESAGSMSIATHMLLNDGNPNGLFQAAIMASGAILKVKDYHQEQVTFNFIASDVGCGNVANKLTCLRNVDYNKLYNTIQKIPNFFGYTSTKVPWYPRPDGTFLKDSPHRLLRTGKVANIPFMIGDMKDEGTLFSLAPQINITNDQDFQSFWKDIYFQTLSSTQIKAFTDLYSQDITQGSPYDTGVLNAIGPQYKRLASAVGDYTFEAGRRDLLEQRYGKQKMWTYQQVQSIPILGQLPALTSLTGLPVLGSFHVSDVVLNSFGTIPPAISKNTLNLMSTYISFVNTHDPNNHGIQGLPNWPQWDPNGKAMYRIKKSGPDVIRDDYREEQMRFINDNGDTYVI